MSGHQKITALLLICTNTKCLHKINIAKLLALNVLSIGLYTFKNFNNIYILQNHLSCHALKIKSTQIIFKQETHSNIIWHRCTVSVLITVLYDNHLCQDIRKSSLYSLSVPTLFLQNYCHKIISFECFVNSIIYF